jgi:hypothetical protein
LSSVQAANNRKIIAALYEMYLRIMFGFKVLSNQF